MKNIIIIFLLVLVGTITLLIVNSCKTPDSIANKSGVQLWGENCARCHNTPSPAAYSDDQWQIISTHMKVKAGLTDTEIKKITFFLKSAN